MASETISAQTLSDGLASHYGSAVVAEWTLPNSQVVQPVEMKTKPISVWLVEDHHAFREMVLRVINRAADMQCTRQFSSVEPALAALRAGETADVVLLDVELPGQSGLAAIEVIKELSPTTQITMLTVFQDDDKVFKAICSGASGYLLKTASSKTILDSIREVMAGGSPMSPKIARAVLTMFASNLSTPAKVDYGLTDREKEVLGLMADGLATKEIADKFGTSYFTVDTQLRTIYAKLHVHSRGKAVSKALKEHLI